ncbi:GNAT family N-acetyltransferase [Streptomyces albipurpureus]|uniref:GNAT family N-acetyltransferase n=1 Tax=Streptomyces albipurpureus TaxID=2897419 RepID=A0ABT0UIV4_9ACTN|nr:GNAT family N-acetyltransferase [Streptomyces sp. CWNU-1]MCM2387368.1 GNAT family N-acetyltransferase [Streptomyces sp. CWNU-1]
MRVEVVPAAERDRDVLGNLLQFYLYDFSELRDLDVTPQGGFAYHFLDDFLKERDREACLFKAGEILVGFSMTRQLDDSSREMSKFFVLRRHRRHGMGKAAAQQVLRRHPGHRTLSFDRANHAAAHFWPPLVSHLASGPVQRREIYPPDTAYAMSCLRFQVPQAP